jgi:hypothetical protein
MIKHGATQNAVLNLAGDRAAVRSNDRLNLEIRMPFEKHPPGGSPDQFMKLGIPEQEAYDLYNRLVGEVAARNAQKRLDWGDIIRRYRRPATTEDVPRHRHINLYDE